MLHPFACSTHFESLQMPEQTKQKPWIFMSLDHTCETETSHCHRICEKWKLKHFYDKGPFPTWPTFRKVQGGGSAWPGIASLRNHKKIVNVYNKEKLLIHQMQTTDTLTANKIHKKLKKESHCPSKCYKFLNPTQKHCSMSAKTNSQRSQAPSPCRHYEMHTTLPIPKERHWRRKLSQKP